MSFKLEDAKRLTQDMLQRGVIETMEKTSGVMARLPFVEVVGSAYAYNVMSDLPEVGYRNIGVGYTPSNATVKDTTESLCILGGYCDTDVYLQRTHANFNDLRAMNVEAKAKATARQFEKDFFNGNGQNADIGAPTHGQMKKLKGLEQRLIDGIAGTEIFAKSKKLDLHMLNLLLDSVVDGADALFMSKSMRRQLMTLLQSNYHYIENGTDAFGRPVAYYGGVAIVPVEDSLIPANRVYAVKFGEDQYVHGLSNGGIQVRDLGEMDTIPVYRTVIEFYCGVATKHVRSFAVINLGTTAISTHIKGNGQGGAVNGGATYGYYGVGAGAQAQEWVPDTPTFPIALGN